MKTFWLGHTRRGRGFVAVTLYFGEENTAVVEQVGQFLLRCKASERPATERQLMALAMRSDLRLAKLAEKRRELKILESDLTQRLARCRRALAHLLPLNTPVHQSALQSGTTLCGLPENPEDFQPGAVVTCEACLKILFPARTNSKTK